MNRIRCHKIHCLLVFVQCTCFTTLIWRVKSCWKHPKMKRVNVYVVLSKCRPTPHITVDVWIFFLFMEFRFAVNLSLRGNCCSVYKDSENNFGIAKERERKRDGAEAGRERETTHGTESVETHYYDSTENRQWVRISFIRLVCILRGGLNPIFHHPMKQHSHLLPNTHRYSIYTYIALWNRKIPMPNAGIVLRFKYLSALKHSLDSKNWNYHFICLNFSEFRTDKSLDCFDFQLLWNEWDGEQHQSEIDFVFKLSSSKLNYRNSYKSKAL